MSDSKFQIWSDHFWGSIITLGWPLYSISNLPRNLGMVRAPLLNIYIEVSVLIGGHCKILLGSQDIEDLRDPFYQRPQPWFA